MVVNVTFELALALHRQGRTDDAAIAYERIVLAEPAHLEALIHLGAIRLEQGRAEQAELLLRRAATISDRSPEAFGNLAAALQGLARYEEAVTYYERALVLAPGMQDARFGLAACLQACGRHEAALACYDLMLATEPAHPEANFGLATLLAERGRVDDAAAKYRAALAIDPDFAEASFGLGKLLARDTPAEAVGCFLQALDVDPDYTEARFALGSALAQLRRDQEAMAAYEAVLAAAPTHADAHNGIGILLDRARRHSEAIEHYRAAVVLNPEHVDAMAGMANAMKNIGRHEEAVAVGRRLRDLRPNSAPAASLLGTILAEIGSIDDALAQLRDAVALEPDRPEFAYHLVLLAPVRRGDAIFETLEGALPRAATLSVREQCWLHFALAKAYDDIGEPDRGFAHLVEGNRIKRSEMTYDEPAVLRTIDAIPHVFTAELMAARHDVGEPSSIPVFIVGMPRSGTTLVEQILASHRDVFGAGERFELSEINSRLDLGGRRDVAAARHALRTLTSDELRAIGAGYVRNLQSLAPDAARITDKMPMNFLHIGLIRLILPNARIIHVVRDPLDTCMSCFSKLFTGEQAFSYDLGELGRYYRAYERLMRHWRTVLPANVFLDVAYEDLTRDLEMQARRMVAHCGLAWDPACLEFHTTARSVQTASFAQVRQPIHRRSVGRWRPDAATLRPLLDALGGG